MKKILIGLLLLLGINLNAITMGIDISLISKGKDENTISYNQLSRSFCNFLCGPDAFENSEFEQLEKLSGLDLSLFRSYPVNVRPNTDNLEYQLDISEDPSQVEKIQAEIKRVQKEWEVNYDSINEGWIKVDELKALTTKLIEFIKTNPKYKKQLTLNLNWGDYFSLKPSGAISKHGYIENTLLEDLESLLKGIKLMEQNQIDLVYFEYG